MRGDVLSGDEHSESTSISDDESRSSLLEEATEPLVDAGLFELERRPAVDATNPSQCLEAADDGFFTAAIVDEGLGLTALLDLIDDFTASAIVCGGSTLLEEAPTDGFA